MKSIRRIAICLLLGVTPVASAQLALRLESDVGEKLPGLPVRMRVVAVNTGATAIKLPSFVYFHASGNGKESFVGSQSTPWEKVAVGDDDLEPGWDSRLTLAPGATMVGDLPISARLDGPHAVMHPFLFAPGRYTLRALAAPGPQQMTVPFERNATLQETMAAVPGLTVSPPLMIDIVEPQGVDSEAWKFILTATNGDGWFRMGSRNDPLSITRTLRARFPASQYTYYFGTAYLEAEPTATVEEVVALLRQATPRPPTLERAEILLAARHDSQCAQHYLHNPPEIDAAIAACDTARAIVQRIAQTAEDPTIRAAATEMLPRIMNAEEIRNWVLRHEAGRAGTYQPVTPVLQCVKDTGARLEARFGYNNPNSFIVYNPNGKFNFFTPGPEDRGQPTRFLPGVHENVVTVEVEGKRNDPQRTIAWTLDGTTVSVPAENAPRCKGK